MGKHGKIDSVGDAERLLDKKDVDDVSDLRRAHGSHRHHIAPVGESAYLGLNADAAPGQLTMNYAVLDAVLGNLIRKRQEVQALANQAVELTGKVNHGHGPIADAIRTAFHQRSNDAQGVIKMLADYGAELDRLIDALSRSKSLYDRFDQEAAQQLTASGGDDA